MKLIKSKLTFGASNLVLALLIGGANGALAQEVVATEEATIDQTTDDRAVLDTIIVTGIRGSLERATEIKRNSVNSVEAVAMEDLGKLPDQNVAESLQRVPGVTIERNRGDGQFISVRGLGPDFNAVTINGRTIATDNVGRAFSFDVLPSELISGASVYKSPTAAINGASIGASVDISTMRPLDQDPFKAVVNVRSTYNELAESNSPSLSGLFSYHNEAKTLGVALAASFVERDIRSDAFTIGAGHTPRSSTAGGYFDGRLGPNVAEFENVDTPSNLSPFFVLREDSRLGLSGVLQYRPVENLTMTFDTLYTKLDQTTDQIGVAFDFSGGTLVEQVVENNAAVYQRIEGGFVDQILELGERPAETVMVGYNAEWQSDSFELSFDASYSKAKLDSEGYFTTIRRTDMTLEYDRRNGNKIYDFNYSSPNYPNAPTDVDNVAAHYVAIGSENREDQTLEFRLDGKWDSGEGVVASAGIAMQNREKTRDTYGQTPDVQCAFCGGEVYTFPSSLFTPTNMNWFEGEGGNVVREWIQYDERELTEAMRAYDGPYVDWMETDGYADPVYQPEASSAVEEDVLLGYIMFDYDTELAGMPFALNTGLRMEATEFSSSGAAQTILSAQPNGLGQNIIVLSDVVPISFEGDYFDILPSLNARLDLTDQLVARFATSRVMTRPTLDDLSPAQTILSNPGNEAISRGNPDLLPFRASQMELGLEWYFNELGLLSLTGFYKNVDSFVTSTTTPEMVDQVTFQVTEPANGEGAVVKGLEIGYRQAFDNLPSPFDGLGAEASYTYVSSDANYENELTGVSYGLEGLSENSYSLVGFYEKGPVQARLAYTYRDPFLQVAFGRNGDPEYFDEYQQLDGSFSFAVTDNFTVSVDALNLTDENEFIYSTTPDRTKEYRTTGRRFMVGVRANF